MTAAELRRFHRHRAGAASSLAGPGARPRRLDLARLALAARHDIDLHFAVDLIERGCPHETAFEILIWPFSTSEAGVEALGKMWPR